MRSDERSLGCDGANGEAPIAVVVVAPVCSATAIHDEVVSVAVIALEERTGPIVAPNALIDHLRTIAEAFKGKENTVAVLFTRKLHSLYAINTYDLVSTIIHEFLTFIL